MNVWYLTDINRQIRAISQKARKGKEKRRGGTCDVIDDFMHHAIELSIIKRCLFPRAQDRSLFRGNERTDLATHWLSVVNPVLSSSVRWIISLALANAETASWIRNEHRCSFWSRLHRCRERNYQSRHTKSSIVAGSSAIGVKKCGSY